MGKCVSRRAHPSRTRHGPCAHFSSASRVRFRRLFFLLYPARLRLDVPESARIRHQQHTSAAPKTCHVAAGSGPSPPSFTAGYGGHQDIHKNPLPSGLARETKPNLTTLWSSPSPRMGSWLFCLFMQQQSSGPGVGKLLVHSVGEARDRHPGFLSPARCHASAGSWCSNEQIVLESLRGPTWSTALETLMRPWPPGNHCTSIPHCRI